MKKVNIEELIAMKRFKVRVDRVQSLQVQEAVKRAGYTWRHSATLKVRDLDTIAYLYLDDFVTLGKYQLSWTGALAKDKDWFKYLPSEEVELI